MDEGFVPLADLVRGHHVATRAPVHEAVGPVREMDRVAQPVLPAYATVLNDLALLRLAAIEAFERGTAGLLEGLARDVLARELRLGAADIAALVERALASFADAEPVEVLVAASDTEAVRSRLSLPLPVHADGSLAAGDLIVNVRDGSFESFVAFRFDAVASRPDRSEGS